jgi:hypothetical protein
MRRLRRYSHLMNGLNQNRAEYSILLSGFVHGADAWGTELGARVFADLNLRLLGCIEGTTVLFDYSGLQRSDVSFQREAVVETLRKHRPRLLFVAVHLDNRDIQENLELALERRGESLILRIQDGLIVLGRRLSRELEATLQLVWEAKEMTSALLRKQMPGTELSTASSRLTALWKAGLIRRVEGTSASGGREHRYYPIT